MIESDFILDLITNEYFILLESITKKITNKYPKEDPMECYKNKRDEIRELLKEVYYDNCDLFLRDIEKTKTEGHIYSCFLIPYKILYKFLREEAF